MLLALNSEPVFVEDKKKLILKWALSSVYNHNKSMLDKAVRISPCEATNYCTVVVRVHPQFCHVLCVSQEIMSQTLVSRLCRRSIRCMFFSMVAWQVMSSAHSARNQPLSPSRRRSPSYQPETTDRHQLRFCVTQTRYWTKEKYLTTNQLNLLSEPWLSQP